MFGQVIDDTLTFCPDGFSAHAASFSVSYLSHKGTQPLALSLCCGLQGFSILWIQSYRERVGHTRKCNTHVSHVLWIHVELRAVVLPARPR